MIAAGIFSEFFTTGSWGYKLNFELSCETESLKWEKLFYNNYLWISQIVPFFVKTGPRKICFFRTFYAKHPQKILHMKINPLEVQIIKPAVQKLS